MSAIDNFLTQMAHELSEQHRPPPGEQTPATKLLLADLEASRTDANKDAVDAIVARAKAEQYHDFLSDSAFPILDLVSALKRAGLTDLTVAAKQGKYDA